MNRRILCLALALSVAFPLAISPALADDRLAQALHYMQEAVHQGHQRDAGLVAYHAALALENAEAIEKFKPNPHTAEAIVHIKAAIDEGRQNHADAATKHAEEAVKHLEQAIQSQ
jgi:hypothetical protein